MNSNGTKRLMHIKVLRKGVVGLVSIHADEGSTQLDTPFIRRGQCVLLSLAGKVACELYESGRVASGCQSDLYKAFSLLQSGAEENAINGVGLLSPKAKDETSESLKARVENVVASELERYPYLCRDILIKNRDFVLALADELNQKETLLIAMSNGFAPLIPLPLVWNIPNQKRLLKYRKQNRT